MRETTGTKYFRIVVITFLTIFTAVPVYVMITSALKPLSDVQGPFSWWPSSLTFAPFIDMWKTVQIGRASCRERVF